MAETVTKTGAPARGLTIVIVGIERHLGLIRRNLELIEELNPGADWKALVVDNSETGFIRENLRHPRCEVVSGVPWDRSRPSESRGSYHHADALNLAMRLLSERGDDRYVLVLDPDFYVLRSRWIEDCLLTMQRRDLSFFGAPWHPQWYPKYRYFPCVHFLLIDNRRVPIDSLDFSPRILEEPHWTEGIRKSWRDFFRTTWRAGKAYYDARGNRVGRLALALGQAWYLLLRKARLQHSVWLRCLIFSSKDTGYLVWRRYSDQRGHRWASLLPVVDFRQQMTKYAFLRWPKWRKIESRLPFHAGLLPQEESFVESREIVTFNSPEVARFGAELFWWSGAAFGLHLRKVAREARGVNPTPQEELAGLNHVLSFLRTAWAW